MSRRCSQAPSPERTCVGCRAAAAQNALLRLAEADGRIVPDPGRRLPGRGAYLHPSEACVERALRRGALARALRARADLPPKTVEWIHEWRRSASTR